MDVFDAHSLGTEIEGGSLSKRRRGTVDDNERKLSSTADGSARHPQTVNLNGMRNGNAIWTASVLAADGDVDDHVNSVGISNERVFLVLKETLTSTSTVKNPDSDSSCHQQHDDCDLEYHLSSCWCHTDGHVDRYRCQSRTQIQIRNLAPTLNHYTLPPMYDLVMVLFFWRRGS